MWPLGSSTAAESPTGAPAAAGVNPDRRGRAGQRRCPQRPVGRLARHQLAAERRRRVGGVVGAPAQAGQAGGRHAQHGRAQPLRAAARHLGRLADDRQGRDPAGQRSVPAERGGVEGRDQLVALRDNCVERDLVGSGVALALLQRRAVARGEERHPEADHEERGRDGRSGRRAGQGEEGEPDVDPSLPGGALGQAKAGPEQAADGHGHGEGDENRQQQERGRPGSGGESRGVGRARARARSTAPTAARAATSRGPRPKRRRSPLACTARAMTAVAPRTTAASRRSPRPVTIECRSSAHTGRPFWSARRAVTATAATAPASAPASAVTPLTATAKAHSWPGGPRAARAGTTRREGRCRTGRPPPAPRRPGAGPRPRRR